MLMAGDNDVTPKTTEQHLVPPPEMGVVWVTWSFWGDETTLFKFHKCIDYGE